VALAHISIRRLRILLGGYRPPRFVCGVPFEIDFKSLKLRGNSEQTEGFPALVPSYLGETPTRSYSRKNWRIHSFSNVSVVVYGLMKLQEPSVVLRWRGRFPPNARRIDRGIEIEKISSRTSRIVRLRRCSRYLPITNRQIVVRSHAHHGKFFNLNTSTPSVLFP
jgi:hypothetical protein